MVALGTALCFQAWQGRLSFLVVPTFLPPEGGGWLWWAGGDRLTIGPLPYTGASPSNGWHSFLLAALPREGALSPTCNFVGVLRHHGGEVSSEGGGGS